jgi:phospholipase C
MTPTLSRRRFLAAASGAIVVLGSPSIARASTRSAPGADPSTAEALRALGRSTLRTPDSLPNPLLPPGTDTMPQIQHIVALMLENHSYDNFLGMLGRGRGQRQRGDGFTLDRSGQPTATNPYPDGRIQHAFRMPTTCQLPSRPSQEWAASHNAYGGGRMDGFVRTPIDPFTSELVGGVAMGYWTEDDLPFTYSLASTFPVADRWFSSVMAQTDPNRRFLVAATSSGMTDDIGTGPGNVVPDASLALPANGTIFNRLDRHAVSWANYSASYPTGATPELYPANDAATESQKVKPFDQFFADASAGNLPGFSLLDPDYGTQSQENPQNIVAGEAVLAKVVQAIGASPTWGKALLVVTWDEHGGYYDHVPPPAALAPDAIPPLVQPGESSYDGFRRYGFRVPAIVVSPYARRGAVTSVIHDHTSIAAMLERKWNLPAMTYRDANANDMTDFLDVAAARQGRPTFPQLPPLAAAGDTPAALQCSRTGPGTIPPPGSVTPGR